MSPLGSGCQRRVEQAELTASPAASSDAASSDAASSDAASSDATSSDATSSSRGGQSSPLPSDVEQPVAPSAEQAGSRGTEVTASQILGNPKYPAMCYGGYRGPDRDDVPSVLEISEDLKILAAMGVKLVRTYNTQQYDHARRLLEAIEQLRREDPAFEMYVMLGAWIECEGAWSEVVNHEGENLENNKKEINAAIELANTYPASVKIIAVGNEAMVHWATSYFVRPVVIRKWVDHLQSLKAAGQLSPNLWITSSDNFASWGGGDNSYHTDELKRLIDAVDYISLHTYPFHDTHYNAEFWVDEEDESSTSVIETADAAMQRATDYAVQQFQATADYIEGLGSKKPLHIGETGWATIDGSLYGKRGSGAADEYKSKRFYDGMRSWANDAGVSCFFFEAFDERWKDSGNPDGSENHFGFINLQSQAKYALWNLVDAGAFDGLTRDGTPISKTFGGDKDMLLAGVHAIAPNNQSAIRKIAAINEQRNLGEVVEESTYVILDQSMFTNPPHQMFDPTEDKTYPSESLKLNVWEGTCGMELSDAEVLVSTGTGTWWGCALEFDSTASGEDLSRFQAGALHFEIKGDATVSFEIGMQTGRFSDGTQRNLATEFSPQTPLALNGEWKTHTIQVTDLIKESEAPIDLSNTTSVLFLKGNGDEQSHQIRLRNVFLTQP
ncbi:MAG: hypothetical protein ACPGLY_18945 [Rubripirellula sp.]